MKKEDAVITRFENQITEIFNTLIELEKLEQEKPIRRLSNWHETALWMTFFSQVLLKNCWENIFKDKLTIEQRSKYIQEVWKITNEHFLTLYWYDAKQKI